MLVPVRPTLILCLESNNNRPRSSRKQRVIPSPVTDWRLGQVPVPRLGEVSEHFYEFQLKRKLGWGGVGGGGVGVGGGGGVVVLWGGGGKNNKKKIYVPFPIRVIFIGVQDPPLYSGFQLF